MLFCDVFRKTVEPLSGSGRLISGEYDNSTKSCTVQAILESLMSLRSAWARYQTVRRQKKNINMLPYFLTYSILLSTDIRRPPWLQTSPPCIRLRAMWKLCRSVPSAGEKRFWTFATFPIFQHRGIYFPPPANGWRSPFLSRTGNVLHASVNQLLHSYPLQEEAIWYPGPY